MGEEISKANTMEKEKLLSTDASFYIPTNRLGIVGRKKASHLKFGNVRNDSFEGSSPSNFRSSGHLF